MRQVSDTIWLDPDAFLSIGPFMTNDAGLTCFETRSKRTGELIYWSSNWPKTLIINTLGLK